MGSGVIFQRAGIEPLAFDEESPLQVLRLPALHRDPFDRMLIQAIAGSLAIVTPDPLISQYPVRVIW
jgi:PIN domain nuclease of toxin-antitoxin system